MNHTDQILDKIISIEEAQKRVKQWQNEGDKVVFSNGCFDILHQGHVIYLSKAASLGQKMVLGLNTDASVSRLKGPNRPLNDQKARAILLAALGFIDAVVYFEEDTPYELIKAVQPDFLVKGNDYNAKDIVGYDIVTGRGGEVVTIELEEGFSTSNVIDKIKAS